jgi:hypothetical protein
MRDKDAQLIWEAAMGATYEMIMYSNPNDLVSELTNILMAIMRDEIPGPGEDLGPHNDDRRGEEFVSTTLQMLTQPGDAIYERREKVLAVLRPLISSQDENLAFAAETLIRALEEGAKSQYDR